MDADGNLDVIGVPAPAEVETSRPSSVRPSDIAALLEPEQDEDTTHRARLTS